VAVLVGAVARDEAALHRSRLPDVTVIEARDRVHATERAKAQGAAAAVLDDGFQHRRLRRDLDVVLLAAEDAFPGSVLPAGPYRERPEALGRADVVLVTRRRASVEASRALAERVGRYAPGRVLGGVELALDGWRRLDGEQCTGPVADVVALCAIARPETFRSNVALRVRGSVEMVAFPDHHDYTAGDVAGVLGRSRGRPLVVTEKDAVKLQEHAGTLGEVFVLGEEVRWDWGEDAFLARLDASLAGAR
jgi:tetraacyldisaccharide 4'-kinase